MIGPDQDRPRIGQWVILKSGQHAEVLSVTRSGDALRSKSEVEVLLIGPVMSAELGADWMNRYYEATIQHGGGTGKIEIVTPRDVAEVYEPE